MLLIFNRLNGIGRSRKLHSLWLSVCLSVIHLSTYLSVFCMLPALCFWFGFFDFSVPRDTSNLCVDFSPDQTANHTPLCPNFSASFLHHYLQQNWCSLDMSTFCQKRKVHTCSLEKLSLYVSKLKSEVANMALNI